MTRHIPYVAAFQIAQGCLECSWGLVFAISPGDGEYAAHLFFAGLGASLLGLVRILAGLLNVFLRGRRLGMVAVVLGLVSSITLCCGPTAVALCAYGLVVYSNRDVRRAFARHSTA